ncbi:DNA-binding transcriptional repressor DeoR [Rahnella aquatilis]|uniref:Transcriptional regulator of sugar metabolism n=1 Tax=Rahnella aquatilis (strain ATCC 33071 / DSM 4594 / JCM 1683 / NBRC 105701 / NCIMB 13365 / CIP 78.65) TaxID=745277 RepID=H2IUZ3_RAHAC|nr:DNA-binding transcriptional repressor DeoR [Rahnella aquatilis]AEX52849.1 transcriptional regulator of sugar metabolism [Rahnella aquatilis CIP 78.65 = ATCC 33071]KFD05404.1 DeoR family deoxyribose operon repressor [Rahnella aquatilis CIP 78.65 = ATCC 33071]
MENKREDRIQRLLLALKKTDKIHLKEASLLLNVSEMTVRRDLNAAPAPVILLGGYIVIDPKNNPATHYFISEQKTRQVAEKQRLAARAASLIQDNDTVFFDCGTTMPYVIESIADDRVFTAICYSLNTFLALQEKPHCEVILCGGAFKSSNSIFTPIGRSSELDFIRPAKAFISAAGVSIEHGVTCFNFDELLMKHQAIARSAQSILVVDSSKFDQIRPAAIAPLARFNVVVSNAEPPQAYLDFCEQSDIPLLV